VITEKDADEINCLRVAGKFTEFMFKELIERIESDIDEQKPEKHDIIRNKVEAILENCI